MAGPQHARMSRADLERAVISYAGATYPFDVREYAVRAVNQYNEIQADPLDPQEFNNTVIALVAKLNVTMPNVPANLNSLSDAQLVTLADNLELAMWDYNRRTNALGYCHDFWVKQGVAPTLNQYADLFITVANYIRAVRGLSPIS